LYVARLALVLACLTVSAAIPHAAPSPQTTASLAALQHAIDTSISTPGLERASWGLSIVSLRTGESLYALNSAKLMMPASTLKVVTLAASGERLGWDYSYETRIIADGAVSGDRLDGNLVIVASGDPSLTRRVLDTWAAQIKAVGIKTITGTVLVDARRFGGERLGPGWSWDDLAYYYAAPVTAAQFRENSVDLTLRPGPAPGAPPSYELTPPAISGLRVDNRMVTGAATAPAEFVAHREPSSNIVVIEGVVPARSRPVLHALSVPDPVRFLAAAFAEALFDAGVSIRATPPPDARVDSSRNYDTRTAVLVYHSEPLRELARRFIDVSQNQYGEVFVKTLGAVSGTPTFEGGVKAVESVLASWNIPIESTVLRDGSGLSRYNYVAPETLVAVLDHVYRDPVHREPVLAALMLAGRSGTVAGRMRNTPAAGNARVKDGSMAGVRALCGIVSTGDGEPLAFAILANGFGVPGTTVTAAIDDIVVRLASFRR
jgi:D-alanyl-D-alanine carboxypeptidase/D-alanyl-D-alanine-endopeptidase (penicillin-binding protein 4)